METAACVLNMCLRKNMLPKSNGLCTTKLHGKNMRRTELWCEPAVRKTNTCRAFTADFDVRDSHSDSYSLISFVLRHESWTEHQ